MSCHSYVISTPSDIAQHVRCSVQWKVDGTLCIINVEMEEIPTQWKTKWGRKRNLQKKSYHVHTYYEYLLLLVYLPFNVDLVTLTATSHRSTKVSWRVRFCMYVYVKNDINKLCSNVQIVLPHFQILVL